MASSGLPLDKNDGPGASAVLGLYTPLFDFQAHGLLPCSADLMSDTRIGDLRVLGKEERFGENNGERGISLKGQVKPFGWRGVMFAARNYAEILIVWLH